MLLVVLALQQREQQREAFGTTGRSDDADRIATDSLRAGQRLTSLVNGCRLTHESYATYFSTQTYESGIDYLRDNPLYLDYWRTGAILARTLPDDSTGRAALEFLYHLVMAPAVLTELERQTTDLWDRVDVALREHVPDVRLAAVTRLLQDHPKLASRVSEVVSQPDPVADRQDELAALLTSRDLPTLDTQAQLGNAQFLAGLIEKHSDLYRVTVTNRSRETALEDQLDYLQAELLAVHTEPAHLGVGPPAPAPADNPAHPLAEFVRDDPGIGPHLWCVLLSTEVLRRQFVTDELPDTRWWGFLAVDRREPPPRARLWPVEESPRHVIEQLSKVGLAAVVMTTMSTLSDACHETPFPATAPVFVLIDQPVRAVLLGLDPGEEVGTQKVLWTAGDVGGDRALRLLILTLDGPDPLYFVFPTSTHAIRAVMEWLRRRPDSFVQDPGAFAGVEAFVLALSHHLIGTFWNLGSTPT